MNDNKPKLLFGKKNLLLLISSLVLIILGFILMSGGRSTDGITFSDAIFSNRRIVVAPIVCLSGFILMIFAIMLPPSKK